jgi:serine/threonine protein kinase
VILGGEASPASDMWSVGCLLSPLLLHRPMFDAKNGKQLMEHIYRVVGRSVALKLFEFIENLRKFRNLKGKSGGQLNG